MRILEHIVGPEREGQPLRSVLRGDLRLSYTLLKSLKWRPGAIRLNGESVHVNVPVRAGDRVSVALSEREERPVAASPGLALSVVYEDEDLLVIDKPAGVAMHPRRGEPEAPDMASALSAYLGDGSAAHFVSRLDKGTSGVFIAAKTGYIHDRLRQALHTDGLRREYRAVALGRVSPESGHIRLPIGRADGSVVKRCIRPDGREAHTEYRVLSTGKQFSLLALLPHTGRTHQLRLHMSALGFPLAGDWLYGKEDRELISRPALHSYSLRFRHPISEKELSFTAQIPEDMRRLLHADGIPLPLSCS